MMPRLASVLLLFLLVPAAAWPQAITCPRARSTVERSICADPGLRRLDAAVAAEYGAVRAATHGATRRALLAQQRAWLRTRDRCPADDPGCLATRYAERRDALQALLARISRGNPDLPNVTAVALLGRWTVGGYRTMDGGPPPGLAGKPASLPASGTTLIGRAGQLCDDKDQCLAFGLDPQPLAKATDGARIAAWLHLPATAPIYTAYVAGQSAFSLLPAPDGTLLAGFDACDPSLTRCQTVFQVWKPAGDGATIRVLAR